MRLLAGLRIAIIHETAPWPVVNGANARVASLIAHFRAHGAHVTVIASRSPHRDLEADPSPYVDELRVFRSPSLRVRTVNRLRALRRWIDGHLERSGLPTLDSLALKARVPERDYWSRYPANLDQYVLALHESGPFDVIVVEYIWMHPAVRRVPKEVPVVLDMHDLMHQRVASFGRNGKRFPLDISAQAEFEILDRFHAVMAIQEAEAAVLEQSLASAAVLRVGIDCYDPQPLPGPAEPTRVLYLGGTNECNVSGLSWFLAEVWPQVHAACPHAELTIAGPIVMTIPAMLLNGGGVRAPGLVSDTAPLYRDASVCVNPIFFGSGLKVKTVEALGKGRPLLTTEIGVEGMNPPPRGACVIAADKEGWIRSLVELCSDHEVRSRLAERACRYAESTLQPDRVYREITTWLSDIAARKARRDAVERPH